MKVTYDPWSRRDDPNGAIKHAPLHRRKVARPAHSIDFEDRESVGMWDARPDSVPRWKRRLDIFGVLVSVVCLWPLMAMIALLIKLSSPGRILFRQERVGRLGERFVLFKFRTMAVGADTSIHEDYTADLLASDKPMTKLDAQGDARLIRFGRLLRAAGLDELPQLINVWRGEMSLVGPRPCLPGEAQRYKGAQRERFLTLPGLTGLWQVSGKNKKTFNEMVQLDIEYVRKRSLLLDLEIIAKTIPAIISEVRDVQHENSQREGEY